MATIGNLPGDRLAGLSADLYHKLQAGTLTIDEFALFVQRKNPFAFERNRHGHIVIPIIGLDLAGVHEIVQCERSTCRITEAAKSCFMNIEENGYDECHRLVDGQPYRIVFIPGTYIGRDPNRTIDDVQILGMRNFGYRKPCAGIIPRIREVVSVKQMDRFGLRSIMAVHDPIGDHLDRPSILCTVRRDDGQWIDAAWNYAIGYFRSDCAFAFLES